MTDEAFYLTPLDVRRMDFKTVMRGYEREAVERFREQVADELERLTRVNADLDQKARGFHEQLRAFRERDKALNDALISAQQLRAESREQAEREAELVLREARADAERLLDAARAQVRTVEEELAALSRLRRGYLAQLRRLVESQLAEVQAAEASEPPTSVSGRDSGPQAKGDAAAQPRAETRREGGGTPTPAWLDTVKKE